jgi:hypothetical protein
MLAHYLMHDIHLNQLVTTCMDLDRPLGWPGLFLFSFFSLSRVILLGWGAQYKPLWHQTAHWKPKYYLQTMDELR